MTTLQLNKPKVQKPVRLPTIYKLTSTGKIQEWTIEINGNSYRTISGQTDGKKTESKPTVCKGKNTGKANETSDEEQALKEAEAKRRLKLEGEYKETVAACTGDVGFVKPMLAKEYKEYKVPLVFPVYSQRKLDGIRCIATKEGMKSRNGKPFSATPHIHEALAPIFAEYPGIIFDGELYADKFNDDFNAICSLVKQAKPTEEDIKKSKASIQYWIYDLVESSIFSARSAKLKKLVEELKSPYIKFLSTEKPENQKQLDALYELYMDEGYEGQIIRLDTPYERKRSSNLLKRKEFKDGEFEIVSVNEGEGNRAGTAGNMTLKDFIDGKTFNSNIKGNLEYVKQLLKDRESLVGKAVTVKYFNLTPDGIPRFPYVTAIRDYE